MIPHGKKGLLMPTIEANESISNFPISDCIVAAYRCIPQVTAIYIDSYKVWIVTNDRHYDTDLWERCYDAECAVLDRYPAMEMTRLPAGIFDDPLTAIPKRARKIYEAIGHSDDTQPEA